MIETMGSRQPDPTDAPPLLHYAEPVTVDRNSRYGVASAALSISLIVIAGIKALASRHGINTSWPILDAEKQSLIGSIASILGIILAVASYCRRDYRQGAAHVGLVLSTIDLFLWLILLMPL
jgi:hypothetical protein